MSADLQPNELRRTSVSVKIFLIVATFSLPIGVLAYLLASVYTPQIATADFEVKGNSLQKPLMKAMANAWTAAGLAETCDGGTGCTEALGKQAAAVKSALDEAEAVNNSVAADLQTTLDGLTKKHQADASLPRLQSKIASLLAAGNQVGTPEGRQQLVTGYRWLADHTRGLISYQGNTSNLILDPDLDSYYLVDVTLLAMPDMMAHLSNAGSLSHKLATGGADAVTEAALARETAAIEDGIKRIEDSNNTSFDADEANHGVSPTLRPKLTDALAVYKSAIQNYAQALKSAQVHSAQSSPAELATLSDGVQAASLTYWDTAASELDALLNARIGDFQTSRIQALGFSALAVAIAAFIAFLLGRSITKPLEELVRNLGPGATLLGSSVERIAKASQSESTDPMESAIICEELNAHADNMRKAVLELARHVEGSNAKAVVGADVSH